MNTKTYAVELTTDNFDRVTDYLRARSALNISALKITDHVILKQNIKEHTRSWIVVTPEVFAQYWEFNNQASYLYFRGIRTL